MSEALWIIVPLLLVGAAPAVLVRRRGGSWLATGLAAFLTQAVATGIAFAVVLADHNYPAMPHTLGSIIEYALPRLLFICLLTVAPVLALVRPIAKGER